MGEGKDQFFAKASAESGGRGGGVITEVVAMVGASKSKETPHVAQRTAVGELLD
ncbi:MAG TPA: hypothetical protein VMD78_06380 [Candidatus Baltobacteraceae bacterium]|nr:hypothetical protein [Candidatus Baltobacteraceae bacterium]